MSNSGNFFIMAFEAVHDIIRKGGKLNELVSYLVLSRHTNGTGNCKHRLSTAGAKAIFQKTTLSYKKAQAALDWLEKKELIKPGENYRKNAYPMNKKAIRWILTDYMTQSASLICLPNSLVDGFHGQSKISPPLKRITSYRTRTKYKIDQVRLDILCLLLSFYLHHELEDYGGVNPLTALSASYVCAPEETHEFYEGLELELHKASSTNQITAQKEFIKSSLFYILDEKERLSRFWSSLHSTSDLGYIYPVIQIWDSDPSCCEDAELLYPLYIRDGHAKESDPHLIKDIHNFLIKSDTIYAGEIEDFFENIRTGGFRFIVEQGQEHHPIGIFRLRFRPQNEATSRWLNADKSRIKVWKELFEQKNS